MTRIATPTLALLYALSITCALYAGEFEVKREAIFEFARKPAVTREGDRVTIAFESLGFCDVTVAVEDAAGRIVRHLASGVLGPNAPAPFAKNTKVQTLLWDSKDDQGRYVDDKDSHAIRVSLGLKPQFERALYWSPHKPVSKESPLICAAPEGVYVFDAMGADHLRLFSHEGRYLRTVYPFPAGAISEIHGLEWKEFPQDGQKLPLKDKLYQCTLLTSGDNAQGRLTSRDQSPEHGLAGAAASALAVHKGRVALTHYTLNRFSTDGTTGAVPLTGPAVTVKQTYGGAHFPIQELEVMPKSLCHSPDGQWLYLAGYTWDAICLNPWYSRFQCLHGVARMKVDGSEPPEPFLGSLDIKGFGAEPGRFRCATSVACDPAGRLYVADYMNDRVQIFSPEGRFLKALATPKPVHVQIHPKSGQLYVFSWYFHNQFLDDQSPPVNATLTRYGPFDDPKQLATCPMPELGICQEFKINRGNEGGHRVRVALDGFADPPVIWIGLSAGKSWDSPQRVFEQLRKFQDSVAGLAAFVEEGGKLVQQFDFKTEARKTIPRLALPRFSRQRLYVNPKSGLLYLGEDTGFNKSFPTLVEIDPETGKSQEHKLPYDTEDMAFDLDGHAYLRTRLMLGRFDPHGWREVPFDYGVEHEKVHNGGGAAGKLMGGIPLHSATLWHHGGLGINAKGNIVVACTTSHQSIPDRAMDKAQVADTGKPFEPRLYPGRGILKKGAILHIFDKHGKLVCDDVVPGLSNLDGAYLGKDNNLYVMSALLRILDGQPYFDDRTGTLMKFRPNAGRVLATREDATPVPIPETQRPKRPFDARDTAMGGVWIENAEWLYGGVGFANTKAKGCNCSNARFALDYFERSFAPEVGHFSIAVLDGHGNLILRVGRYGNEDDGMPLVADGASPAARSIGGDEVALMHAAYVATHTDRRLFIADIGNSRIASVRLGYHASERIELKKVSDALE